MDSATRPEALAPGKFHFFEETNLRSSPVDKETVFIIVKARIF